MNKLVQTLTSDGLKLHGYLRSAKNESLLLHIHGYSGNFYENYFIHELDQKLNSKIDFLSVNTRGNGYRTDINTDSGEIIVKGAEFELLEEANLDISAWINFALNLGYKKIYLQGHSLGCIKVARFISEGQYREHVSKLILLAPSDLVFECIPGDYRSKITKALEYAEKECSAGRGAELMPSEYFIFRISKKTFISWYKQDKFGKAFDYTDSNNSFELLKEISIPTKVIYGTADDSLPTSAYEILSTKIPDVSVELIPDALHSFAPAEAKLVEIINNFLS